MRKIIALISVAFILCSICYVGCSRFQTHCNSIIFQQYDTITWSPYLNKPHLTSIHDFFVQDSIIYILGLVNHYWLRTYSAIDGRFLDKYISYGNNYDEIENGFFMYFRKDIKTINIFDINTMRLKEYDSNFSYVNYSCLSEKINCISPITDNKYLILVPKMINGAFQNSYIHKIINGSTGEILSTYCPKNISNEIKNLLIKKLTVSPNGRNYALIYQHYGELSLYDISNDSINLTHSHKYIQTKLETENGCPIIKSNSPYGFRHVTCSNDFVYAIFSDENNTSKTNKIGIWNWNGDPIKLIVTDKNILKIAISSEMKRIIAIIGDTSNGYTLSHIDL